MRKFLYFCCVIILCLPIASGQAGERVVLQLKWTHAYQFAGYYMAEEKGYYRNAGLEVEIREGGPNINFVDEVISGKAHFATGATSILLERNIGKPIVVLGVVFQHSPDVLFVSQASGITHPQQLIGKTVMDSASTPAIAPMLLNEAGSLGKFNLIPQDNNYAGLIEGKFDATAGYSTDEAFFYRAQNFPITILKPVNYGIDFYGDNLFTSEDELSRHPERVKAFRLASFKGWQYAMAHPEETIGVIRKYGSIRTPAHLRFEYETMRELVLPHFVEMGYMNPGRWKAIAETYVKLGQLTPEYSLAGFLYEPNLQPDIKQLKKYIFGISAVTLIVLIFTLMLLLFNRRLTQQSEALRESEQQQRSLITQSPAAIAMLDCNMCYLAASDRWRDDYQLGDQILIGHSHYDIFPEIPEHWREIHRRCLAGATEKCEEDRFERLDGTVQWLRWEVRPWFKTPGKIGGIVMLTEEITTRRQAAEALRTAEEQLRATIEYTPNVAIQWYDQNGRVVFWNSASETMFGWRKEEAVGKTLDQLIHTPEEMATFIATCSEVRRTGKPTVPTEYSFKRRDGTQGTCISTIFAMPEAKGQSYYICMDVDVTERKFAEEEKNEQSRLTLQYKEILLYLSQQQFASLDDHFRALTEAAARALTVERSGIWTLHNNTLESQDLFYASTGAHQRVVPYTLTGASPYINTLQRHEVIRADNARSDPRTCEFGAFLKSRDIHSMLDVPIWHQGSMIGVLGCDHTGTVRHWTDLEEEFASHLAALASIAMEAEERRRAEKTIMDLNESLEQRVAERTAELSRVNAELERARNVAAAASEAKSEFLSRMSHELRTPLHAILGFSQLLETNLAQAAPDEKKSLRQIHDSGQHLLELINEALDLTRIDAGKLELFLEDIDLGDGICTDCLEQVRNLAGKKNITLHLQTGESAGPFVYADRMRLKQILINLLSNAVKYNIPEGSVTLEYHAPRKEKVRVTVTDTGVGIARDQQDRIFKPFTRIHRHDSSIEGTGIGLTITRRLVESMGGEIGFSSVAGEGTTFWLELRAGRKTPRVTPLTATVEERIAATSATPAIKGKLLYIEDTTANVQLMRLIVKRLPEVNLTVAHTAEIGLALAQETPPNLILMDIDLPGMDGIAALKLLRQHAKTKNIPVIAVSAAAMAHDMERIQQAGFDDILSKPFNIQSVPALLLKHLGSSKTDLH